MSQTSEALPFAPAALNMGDRVARMWADLREMADTLYGSDHDLWTLTRLPDRHPQARTTRRLLRCWFGLVQDPISGVWLWMGEHKAGVPSHHMVDVTTAAEECEQDDQG